MWRSKFLTRCSRQAAPLFRNQLLHSKIPILIPSQSLHSSLFLTQNPRFFSQNTNLNDQEDAVFHENPNFHSLDSEPLFANFTSEENPNHFQSDPNFVSDLLDEYTTSSLPEETDPNSSVTQEVTEEVPVVDIEQVESVLSLLQSSVDGSLESTLNKMHLTLNEEFLVRIIETPLVPGDVLIRFFNWVSKKPDFSTSTRVVSSLVQAVVTGRRKKDAYALWDLVKEIGEKEKEVLTTEILNELINLFWKLGKGKAGFEVFNRFEEFGCEPNVGSYYLTIEALCGRSMFDSAWNVCEKMLDVGNLPDFKKIGNIICCFCKGKKASNAHLVYLTAKDKNKTPPRPVLNFLISSLCKEDNTVKLALDLLNDFSGDARKYAIKPFTCVVRSLCRTENVEEAKKLLLKMIDEGPPPGNAVFNFVINGLSKAGEMDEAMRLVNVMESRGLRPDVYTYSIIISGYAKGGQMDDALNVLSEAKKKHSKLCPATFHTLIRGYCKLEEFDKAVELLNGMKESGVKPNVDEYNKMIQTLCLKALDWRTAEKLLEEMKENGVYLNSHIKALVRSVKELEEQELNEGVVSIEA